MKKNHFYFFSMVCLLVFLSFTSCDKEEDYIPQSLLGYWYGVYYENRGETWLNVSFDSDGTGELQLESPSGLVVYAEFNYSVSGNIVKCKGATANTNGEVSEKFSITFLMEDDCLIPQDRWEQFILTQDGSIGTNSNGEIVEDQSKLLQNVWISEGGYELWHFKNKNEALYYRLYEPFSNKYAYCLTYHYIYDYKFKELLISVGAGSDFSQSSYTITKLDSEAFIIKDDKTKKEYKYKRASSTDIPTEKVDKWWE